MVEAPNFDNWLELTGAERRTVLPEMVQPFCEEIVARHKHIHAGVEEANSYSDEVGKVFYIWENLERDDDFFTPILKAELAEVEFSHGKIKTKTREYYDSEGILRHSSYGVTIMQTPEDFFGYLHHVVETGVTRIQLRDGED